MKNDCDTKAESLKNIENNSWKILSKRPNAVFVII
jgi:hypothetical protein